MCAIMYSILCKFISFEYIFNYMCALMYSILCKFISFIEYRFNYKYNIKI